MLVNSTSGHSMFYFMDDFIGENQCKLHPLNAEGTTLKIPMENFHWSCSELKMPMQLINEL